MIISNYKIVHTGCSRTVCGTLGSARGMNEAWKGVYEHIVHSNPFFFWIRVVSKKGLDFFNKYKIKHNKIYERYI